MFLKDEQKNTLKYLLLSTVTYFSYEIFNLCYYIAVMIILGILGIDFDSFLDTNTWLLDTVFCGMLIILFAVVLRLIYHDRGTPFPLEEICEKGRNYHIAKDILKLTVMTFGVGGISILWLGFAGSALNDVPAVSQSLESFSQTWEEAGSGMYIWYFLSVVLLGPVIEEIIFRGFLFYYINRFASGWKAVIATGLLFGVFHGEPVQMVYTAVIGLVLGVIFYRTRSLKAVIYVHILNNFLSALPPAWDTELVNRIISSISVIMILPMFYFVYRMIQEKRAENKVIFVENQIS